MQPLDVVRGPAQASQQIGGMINQVADQMAKSENYTAELEADRLSREYEAAYQAGLKDVQAMKGDPTQAYSQLDAKMAEQFKKMEESLADKISPVQNIIRKKLSETNGRLGQTRLINEASQFKSYQRSENNATVSQITNQRVLDAIQLDTLDPEEKKAGRFTNLDLAIEEIMKIRDRQGREEGLMVSGPNGEQRSAILNDMINQDVSEGVKNVVKALNISGDTETAEKVIEKYKDRMLAKDRIDLMTKTKEAGKDKQAFAIEHDLRLMDSSRALREAEKRTDDPEVLNKVRKLIDERGRINALTKERESTISRDKIVQNIMAVQSQSAEAAAKGEMKNVVTPSRTWLEQQPIWGEFSDRLSATDKKAIYDMLERPKQSAPDARIRMTEYLTDSQRLKGLSAGDFEKAASGLDESDYRTFRTKYVNAKELTEGEYNARYNAFSAMLKTEMKAVKLLNPGDKMSKKQAEMYADYQIELMSALDQVQPNMSSSDKQKYVREFIEDKRKEEPFRRIQFNGGDTLSNTVETIFKTPAERQKWQEAYVTEKKSPPKTAEELRQFIREKNGKLGN